MKNEKSDISFIIFCNFTQKIYILQYVSVAPASENYFFYRIFFFESIEHWNWIKRFS